MRLAYFSPLPPQKSGISDYSEELLSYLGKYYDIDLWVSGDKPNNSLCKKYRVIYYRNSKTKLSKLDDYDVILYNIGNNPEYHAEIYDVFLHYPGYVILHDFVLYYLITGYFLDYKKDRIGYIREFYENYGNEGIAGVKNVLRGNVPPLQFKNPELFPLNKSIIQNATGIIVHSDYTRDLIVKIGYPESRIVKINHLHFNNSNSSSLSEIKKQRLREKYGIQKSDLLIASFGYIAPTKRNYEIIKAINRIIDTSGESLKYIMVGEGNYVDGLLNDKIIKTGFVSNEDLEAWIDCADVIVNLRFPSMGETSGTLIRALSKGKPCIITNNAWFSEIPDGAVLKISFDPLREQKELYEAFSMFINHPELRYQYGEEAKKYVIENHDPLNIADQFFNFFKSNFRNNSQNFRMEYCNKSLFRVEEIFREDISNDFRVKYRKRMLKKLKTIGLENDPKTEGFVQEIKKYFVN